MRMASPTTFHLHHPTLPKEPMFNKLPKLNHSPPILPKFLQNHTKPPPLKEISKQGDLREAFHSFSHFLSSYTHSILRLNPDQAYAPLLELCASKKAVFEGRQIHTHLIKSNVLTGSVFLSTKLVFMYGKCGNVVDAEKAFDKMRERTVFSWNAMIGAYVSNAEHLRAIQMYREVRGLGGPIDYCTFTTVLKACGATEDLRTGGEVHGLVIKFGCDSVVFVANALSAMYAKCDQFSSASKLFDEIREKMDVVSWNSMISAHLKNGHCVEALDLFREMVDGRVDPNSYTFVAALQACEGFSFHKLGREIHAAFLKSSYLFEVYVSNALVSMYVRFGEMDRAAWVFYMMHEKDDVSCNTLLSGFIQNGLYDAALKFFGDLKDAGLKPDQVALISIIAACGRLGFLLKGKEIHAYAIKNGLDYNVQLGNTLVDMYGKCLCMTYGGRVFHRMLDKDYISWSTAVAGYAQNGCCMEAIKLSRQLQIEGMDVDAVTAESILLACSGLKCVLLVKELHGYIIRNGLSDVLLQNTMVRVYGDCGEINYAIRVFEPIGHKDVFSWTSMISSYIHNNQANEALEVFNLMKGYGIEPDSVTLISILNAVASLSALKKGKEIHGFVIRKGFVLEGTLENSIVDMYARCGSLEYSAKQFSCAKYKNLVLWTTMINAYGMHGCGRQAVELFDDMHNEKLVPDHVTFLALLYACSHSGLTEEGRRIFETMKFKYHLEPWPEHYACLVDLLGRANRLEEAYQFVRSMPIEPSAELWCALLSACQVHSNKELGDVAVQKLLGLYPRNPGNYVLVSNVFAASGRWNDVEVLRQRMRGSQLKKNPGCSWIEVKNKVHTFIARDKSHPESSRIYLKLAEITEKLEREGGYVAETKFVLHNVEEKEKVQMLYGHSERLAIAYGLLGTSEGTPIRITKNLRVCNDCHTFCRLVSKLLDRELIIRDASRFHHFCDGVCSCGDFW